MAFGKKKEAKDKKLADEIKNLLTANKETKPVNNGKEEKKKEEKPNTNAKQEADKKPVAKKEVSDLMDFLY